MQLLNLHSLALAALAVSAVVATPPGHKNSKRNDGVSLPSFLKAIIIMIMFPGS
jgi:hypothetical protein